MRHCTRLALLAVASVVGAACEKAAPASPAPDEPAASPLNVVTTPVDTLVTLGAWLEAHPHDVVAFDSPRGGRSERVCRVARDEIMLGSRRVQRSAVFLLPEPTGDLTIPTDTTRIAERFCHLWSIWMEAAEPDSLRAAGFADSLASLMTRALGASREPIDRSDLSPGGLTTSSSWAGRGTIVTLGVAPLDSIVDEMTRVVDVRPRQVVVAAYAVRGGSHHPGEYVWIDDGSGDAESEIVSARIDSAIAWAALPTVATDLQSALEYGRRAAERSRGRTPASDSALLRAVRTIRDTASALGTAQLAAALLAVDLVLNRTVGDLDADSSGADAQLRHELESLGLTYGEDPLGSSQVYTRPLLWEAFRADSAGRVGHEAFMTLLASGWTTNPNCQDGAAEYDKVIKRGEAALQRGDTDPLIHYYVGIANHDIVALSLPSAYGDYVDPSDFKPLAPAARARAVDHFRAFLASASDVRLRRYAWRSAMTLLAGSALHIRYFCIYD